MISPAVSAFDIADYWLGVVHDALAECDRDPVSRAYVAAGEIAWDDCCGMLVVAPERIYRSQVFPTENGNEELCFGGYLVVDLLVLIVRCVPTVDDRGRAPSANALQAAYRNVIEDAAVVWNTVTGFLPDEMVRANVAQTFVGAQGGCIAAETRFTIGVEQTGFAICCPPEPS